MPKKLQCDIEVLKRLYCEEMLTAEAVGAAVGWGSGRCATVLRHLRAAGCKTRKPHERKPKGDPDEIRRLYVDHGMCSQEVAEMVGCSATQVRRVLARMKAARPRGASTPKRRGENAPGWKGGRFVTSQGYVFLRRPEHRQANKNGYVAEHRMVVSDLLGRRLETLEEVHHINGVHGDNRQENLMMVRKGRHQRMHADVCRELWRLRQEIKNLTRGSAAQGRDHGASGRDWKIVG